MILIVSGTHGDERGVISSVQAAIEKYEDQLPSYKYIAPLSPSAVSQGTRTNAQGHDLNRYFKSGTDDIEAIKAMSLLKGYVFDASYDFHEDPTGDAFYVYDCYGEKLEGTQRWESVAKEIKDLGVELLNGIDDPSDPALGTKFVNGLHYFVEDNVNENGMFGSWLHTQGLIRKFLNFEIPGKLPQEKKDKIVDTIFKYLIV